VSVGNNPTFDGVPERQVEAHVLDEDLDLYGHLVDVSFVERIRGMVAYEGREPLIEQIRADVESTRAILGVAPAPEA
jgi:riboflavin kinase/FMN adenylyltransferase